jgi:hypothetical protein
MTTRVKRLLIGLGGVIGLLVAVLLLAPLFIDVNEHRAEVIAEVKKATGRDLVLGGPISLWLLPTPTVRVQDVKVYNATGAKSPYLVDVKSVTVSLSPWALLIGRFEVSEVVLDEPKIGLEINGDGQPNWALTPAVPDAKPAAAQPNAAAVPLSLGRVVIDNGTLSFSDARAGLSVTAEKAQLTASVGGIDGPFSLAGSVTVDGAPLKLELAVGPKGPAGHTSGVTLETGDGKLTFTGTLSELGPQARVAGKVAAATGNLVAFVDTLAKMAGQPAPALPLLLGGPVRFAGDIEASRVSFAAKQFTLGLGDDSGTGSLSVTLAPTLAVDAKLATKRLDFDKWLASLKLPAEVAAPEPTTPLHLPPKPEAPAPRSILLSIDARIALEAREVIYNKQPVRDVVIDLQTQGGAVAVPRLNVVLPGDLRIEAHSTLSGDPARPTVAGEFSLQGDKLRETLTWLGADVSAIPPQKLQTVTMKGQLTSSGGNAEVKDATFQLDELRGSGGIVVAFTVPLSAVMHLDFETIDVDAYVPQRPVTVQGNASSGIPILALLGPAVGLELKIAKLVFRGETVSSIELDVARHRGKLKLNDLKVASLAGARLAVRGEVARYWEDNPKADVAFSFEAPDMGRVLRIVGIAEAGIGPVSASGGIVGTFEQLMLRDVAVSALGWSGRATGTLSLPGAAKGPLKSAAYKGSIAINGHGIQATIDATLGERPNIVADLKADVLDLEAMRGAGRAQASSSASQAIDTEPMRRFDASLHLAAGTLVVPPLRVANADIAVALKDGLLTLSHFTGSLYGGELNLAGTVDGRQPALSYELHGQAGGLPVGEMLRSTSGSNVFGSVINVAIDGRLNASDIVVRGHGATTGELKSSMSGGAQLGGYIRASADRFLQLLGSIAAGAVGGAIDATVGNLMSLAGDKGGVGIGNLLNAISLVLHRYVNHDDGIAGRVDIAGGVLTANGLTVQGEGATARVATQTNLANSTTNTTITFYIAEDPSAPYLITTASGPLSALSFSATRGGASDPPGIENMIPDIRRILPNPSSLIPNVSVPHVPVPSIPVPHIPLPSIPNPFGR